MDHLQRRALEGPAQNTTTFEEEVKMIDVMGMTRLVNVGNEFEYTTNHVQRTVRVGGGADTSKKSDL